MALLWRGTADPDGCGLGVEQTTNASFGTTWEYQGETNGFRVLHIYLPRSGALIAVGVNSAVPATPDANHLGALATSIYQILPKAGLS